MTGAKWETGGFGRALIKQEGYTQDFETGEAHPTTDAERAALAADTSTYMELRIDPKKQTRAEIHEMVEHWLDDYELFEGGV